MLSHLSRNMGLLCSRNRHYNEQDAEENEQAAEIERRIEQETEAEKHIQKLLLLGAGESGKSTIFKQIKLLFQTGFDEAELKSYIPVIHANVYQTIKVLHDGSKELAQNDKEFSKYVLSSENKEIGEKLSDIGGRLDYPRLTRERAQDIETLWKDAAIQETYARGNELQVPDCTQYFMENLQRLSDANYIPTKEDVLYARVRTTGVVEIQFSPVGENKKSGEVYRLFDVGGQRNERRKWIHLFEGVTAVIFCAAIKEKKILLAGDLTTHVKIVVTDKTRRPIPISLIVRMVRLLSSFTLWNGTKRIEIIKYDQTLFEDEQKNRMMETKELFEWVLKQECFEKTSFMLFLNKFDIFEKKVLKVPLSVCEWFNDYQPVSTGKQEIEHAYEFVKKKFEELYFKSTAPDRVDRVFKVYRTTALDQKLVKKTFKLVDETLRRRNLFEAGLL
ncbi:guanine nucleotide-binding protein alpha-1 subunit isoform X1 [Benincasa hispida]|uniref:guanine nucleotide-binding protein alpha-1 subunit isoform X1 n=1 Tax=Benincasa hispida TaxID=102211 RepID=UPI0019023360|nr:guanine nucleotide-binding protein alpha-1 subunit isoform X1 [Benincasa hispida]XP_038900041.1 guanine nucleotide-binding protein alpha-1 subunit isoform X1 [Benincasa hispida]